MAGNDRIKHGSESYPFLAYSREHGLDYGDVLTIAEVYSMRPEDRKWERRHSDALMRIPSKTHQLRIGRLAFLFGKANFRPLRREAVNGAD